MLILPGSGRLVAYLIERCRDRNPAIGLVAFDKIIRILPIATRGVHVFRFSEIVRRIRPTEVIQRNCGDAILIHPQAESFDILPPNPDCCLLQIGDRLLDLRQAG